MNLYVAKIAIFKGKSAKNRAKKMKLTISAHFAATAENKLFGGDGCRQDH